MQIYFRATQKFYCLDWDLCRPAARPQIIIKPLSNMPPHWFKEGKEYMNRDVTSALFQMFGVFLSVRLSCLSDYYCVCRNSQKNPKMTLCSFSTRSQGLFFCLQRMRTNFNSVLTQRNGVKFSISGRTLIVDLGLGLSWVACLLPGSWP